MNSGNSRFGGGREAVRSSLRMGVRCTEDRHPTHWVGHCNRRKRLARGGLAGEGTR